MSTARFHTSESARAKLTWTILGLTVAAWIAAMAIRLTRPVFSAVMDSSQQTVDGAFNAVLLVFVAVGALVAVRQPRNPIGWLLCAMGVLKIIGFLALEYAVHSLFWKPGVLPAGELAAWLWNFAYVPLFLALPCILLLFPDGHLPSPRWRWLAVLLGLNGLVLTVGSGVANWQQRGPALLMGEFDTPVTLGVTLVVTAFTLIAAGVSLIVRYLQARDERRAQLKWLAFSAELIALWIIAELIRQTAHFEEAIAVLMVDALGVIALLSFPAAVGVAVLRYRLYEIDRIISRTVAYATLIGLLGLAYLLAILVLQSALPIPNDSPAIVASSTLVVAAAFGPLRTRVKSAVDRRFNRAGYDAQVTLDAFGARLRSEIDISDLEADLLAVVGDTVRPTHSSLWLSSPEVGE